jgi:peptide/nickel transport system permease protein
MALPSVLDPGTAAPPRPGQRHRALAVIRERGGGAGAAVVICLLAAAAFGPLIAPYSPTAVDPGAALRGPSAHHLLGTDQLGRDLLSRLLAGSRIEMGVAVPSILLAVLLGLCLGVIGVYAGEWADHAVVLVTDAVQSFPAVVLALALLAMVGQSLRNLIIVIALAFMPNYARVSRALVRGVKQEQFILTERALGARDSRIILRHILPNIVAPLFILMAMDLPGAITIEAGLSFLGLGVPPPNPSWGTILSDGFSYIRQSPWPVIWVSCTLAITTIGCMLLGEALRDVLDPRLRGVASWRP